MNLIPRDSLLSEHMYIFIVVCVRTPYPTEAMSRIRVACEGINRDDGC
jgi:hypothetical protein